jgi:mannose-6-phosphate isomerase
MKLHTRYVGKPWGRTCLPDGFMRVQERPVGEVWFVSEEPLPLLAKYLFTSDKLSVQVHPDEGQASARGYDHGKAECWYVLDAEPGASIGLGLLREVGAEELRAAAADGSIVDLIRWRPVRTGDFFYVPSGTIHTIGSGISLLEFQQNSDVTLRLYDHGRGRELHVDDAIAVASRSPYPEALASHVEADEPRALLAGPEFTLVHAMSDTLHDRRRWILPLEGTVRLGEETVRHGECLLASPGDRVEMDGARVLIGAVN